MHVHKTNRLKAGGCYQAVVTRLPPHIAALLNVKKKKQVGTYHTAAEAARMADLANLAVYGQQECLQVSRSRCTSITISTGKAGYQQSSVSDQSLCQVVPFTVIICSNKRFAMLAVVPAQLPSPKLHH